MDILNIFVTVMFIAYATAQRESLKRFQLTPRTAKSVLHRVKRGWLPWEKKEEREEDEEDREARRRNEISRETQARLARECPTKCWNNWGAFGSCCQPCGGAGKKYQSRTVKSSRDLGECRAWVAQNGCPGPSRRSAACNRFCHNQGTPISSGCSCKAGWTGKCCETRVTCPNPGRPANGHTSPSGNTLPYGTTVRFSCNVGYTLNGPTSRQCHTSGTWSSSVPKCNIVQCPTPTTPEFSTMQLISGSAYKYGSSVKVTCNGGYRLQGTAVRQCQANGRWSADTPVCARIVCPSHGAPSHGRVSFSGGRGLDTEATYRCNAGYYLQGSTARKCQSNGQWTGQLPSCQRTKCNNMVAPTHGSVTHTHSSGGKTNHGGKATFTCNPGYVLNGASAVTCTGTGQQGTWSANRPSCQPVNCGDPGTPSHGVKSGSVYTLNGQVSFKCVAGFYLNGATSIRCKNNGRWSAAKPNCLECAANNFKSGTNTATSCSSCPAHSTTSGATGATSRSSCTCSVGYSGAPGGVCTRITCSALPTPQHSTRKACSNTFSGTCTFECKGGHVVSRGDVTRTCGGTGVWSGHALVCDACPVNTYKSAASQCSPCPANTGTRGPGNDKTGCKCKTGWSGPNGGPCSDVNECQNQNGGCDQLCTNSAGSYKCDCNLPGYVMDADDHKKCNSRNQCPAALKPSNGGLVCHSHRQTNSERCQVTCNPGYEHILSPNAFEECGPSTNWKWSHDISGKPILDCVESFFEEVQLELDVFYFASQCRSLGVAEKSQMMRQFVDELKSRGICKAAGQSVCEIDDVRIECGTTGRKKRSASGMEQIKISFMLKSMKKSKSAMSSCGATCKSSYMARIKTQLLAEMNKAKVILVQQTGARPNEPNHGSPGARPSMSIGGITLFSPNVTHGQFTTTCSTNMVRSGDICATCPPGSYKSSSRDECLLCPVGSYQNSAGQMHCYPCRIAIAKGSKTCSTAHQRGLLVAGAVNTRGHL